MITQNSITLDNAVNYPSNDILQDTQTPVKNIRFIPIKVKDFIKIFQNDHPNNGQIQVTRKNNILEETVSPQDVIDHIPVVLPTSINKLLENQQSPQSPMRDTFVKETSNEKKARRSLINLDKLDLKYSPNTQEVYAMPDVTAFPVVGSSGYRSDIGNRKKVRKVRRSRIRRSPSRVSSKSRLPKKSRSIKRYSSTSRPRSIRRSRSFSRSRSRSKPKVRRSTVRPMPLKKRSTHEDVQYIKVRPSRNRSVRRKKVVAYTYEPDSPCCTRYPLCDNESIYSLPKPVYVAKRGSRYTVKKPEYVERYEANERRKSTLIINNDGDTRKMSRICPCKTSEDLQFIMPGVCSKKDKFWTNEYAIIPKPQIHLMDPCKELDPIISPRANSPCIRDRRGNPLTDCIGRPLRDPTGKKFLKFTANGSIMDTNFRGNFYSGQPPLCVKQPLPRCSCAHDTTHNWWMSNGYPIRPNMGQFFKQVVRNNNG